MNSPVRLNQQLQVALYARYSSDLQREASIDDQLRVCRARAEREGWHITETFADGATSGSTMLRPGYQALLTAIRDGKVQVVLAESLDRFSRDLEHIASFHKQCVFHQVRIHTVSEGEISELHIGLKGTMGALYLKDLADKTRRGLEGRIRAGRCTGTAAYGYDVVRQFSEAGELDRGLRAIVPEEAAIVQRIFRDYVVGMSPRRIAMALNAEGIPGPGGGAWYNSSILGRAKRGDGLLRNQLYIGKLVWRRRVNAKDPTTGATVRRDADPDTYVVREVPALRIIDDALWQRVQQRLDAEAAPVKGNQPAFWDRRRPRHLLSGKVICGGCGRPFSVFGQDYLGCNAARHGTCHNRRTIRRPALEARVLDSLGRQLMDPGRVAEFVATFHAEWNRLAAEARAQVNVEQRERAALDRKIANLVDAISEGRSSQALRAKLTELEGQRAKLGEAPEPALSPAPLLQPSIASTYAAKVADLRSALAVGANPEAMEAARALIERVVVHPPEIDDDPPRIELIGELMALLTTAGLGANDNRAGASRPDPVLELFVSSVKAAPGAKPRSSLILSAPSIRTTTRAV